MSFLLSLPPSRRRCFARVVSDCHCKVISHSDGHSIVKVHWRFLSPQGVAGGVRGEYPTSKNVFNLFLSLTNWRIFWEFGKKLFDVPTFNCLFPLGNGIYQAFVPSLVPNWVGRFGRPFLKNFLLKTQKPPKSLINRAFSAVKFFWNFSNLIAKRQKTEYNYRKGQLMIWQVMKCIFRI